MIQTLLDRIQHPERVPVWREPLQPFLPDFVEQTVPGLQFDPNNDGYAE